MKNKIKRILCILCGVIMISSLSSCVGPETGSKNSSPASSSGTSSKSGNDEKLFSEPVTFSLLTYEHPHQAFNTKGVKFGELTKKTNVTLDIDVTTSDSYTEKMVTVLASGTLYDINWLFTNQMFNYPTSLYMDLTDKLPAELNEYYKFVKDDDNAKKLNIKGRTYGLITLGYPEENSSKDTGVYGFLPVIRHDILEKHNLPVPETFDQWFSVMKKLKTLYPDSTPWAGRLGNRTPLYMEYAMGAQRGLYYDYDKKKYVFGILEPEYRNVLQFLVKCYAEGILDPNYVASTPSSWNEAVNNNRVFFWYDNNGFAADQTLALQKSNPEAKMQVMPLMKNSSGKKRGLYYYKHHYDIMYALSAKTKEPEKLVKFMNWCYSDEGMLVNNFGVEGETYIKDKDGIITLPDSIIKKFRNVSSPVYSYRSTYGLGYLCFAPLVRETASVNNALLGANDGKENYSLMKDDIESGALKEQVVDPILPENIRSDIISKQDSIQSMLNRRLESIISGKESINTLDQIISAAKQMGADEVLKAYNDALK